MTPPRTTCVLKLEISEEPSVIEKLTSSNLDWIPVNENVFLINDVDKEPRKHNRIALLNKYVNI